MTDLISWFMASAAMLFMVFASYIGAFLATWMIIGDRSSPYQGTVLGLFMVLFGGVSLVIFRDILDRL